MRPHPDKTHAKFLDLSGCIARLGFPDEPYDPPESKEKLKEEEHKRAIDVMQLIVGEEPTEITREMVVEKLKELHRAEQEIPQLSFEQLDALYRTTRDPYVIVHIAHEIYYRKFNVYYNEGNINWIVQHVQAFMDEFPEYESRLLATLRTRAKNIVARGKKLASLKYFFSLDPDEGFLIGVEPYNLKRRYEVVYEDYDIDDEDLDSIPF
jgi:hypothetical protein